MTPGTATFSGAGRTPREALIGVNDEEFEMLDAGPSSELSLENYVNQVSLLSRYSYQGKRSEVSVPRLL